MADLIANVHLKTMKTPATEYIVATEQACTKIDQGKQDEFKGRSQKVVITRPKKQKAGKREQGGTQGIKRTKAR